MFKVNTIQQLPLGFDLGRSLSPRGDCIGPSEAPTNYRSKILKYLEGLKPWWRKTLVMSENDVL